MGAVRKALGRYLTAFSGHVDNITTNGVTEDGFTVIRRLGDAQSKSAEDRPEVQVAVDAARMTVQCRFSLSPERNRTFPLVLLEDGAIGLADSSLDDLVRYVLAPVLFNRLGPEDWDLTGWSPAPEKSLAEVSDRVESLLRECQSGWNPGSVAGE
jgi:hypothetical protein